MAHPTYEESAFDPASLQLSTNEQSLLITALNSNKPARNGSYSTLHITNGRKAMSPIQNGSTFTSPNQQAPGSTAVTSLDFDASPFLDYDLEDGNFENWDMNGGQMIGDLPGTSVSDEDQEHHDKRKKSSDDNGEDDEDGGGKRREGDDRSAKKPGRKPLTSEPTTKRKAQNRAAQRAFRERKEQHLKNLETKVEDLEKASESANHENGLLRAQVERLTTELREYRKRLSLVSNAPVARSPPQPVNLSSRSNWDINNNFQFEFPKFGAITPAMSTAMAGPLASNRAPGAHLPNGNKGSSNRNNTNGSVQSRSSSMNQAKGLYNVASEIADLSHLFSPSILASVSPTGSGDYMSFNKNVAQPSPPVLQTNSQGNGGASDTTSPSSLQTLDSSCGTTPEPSIDSPGQRKISGAGDNSWQVSDQQEQFCEQFAQACGNKDDPIPPTLKQSNIPAATATLTKTPALEFPGFDWMAAQNGGNFNPVLFGDYRDPQENIMSADFGDFFNEAFPMPDIGSPLNVPLEPALPKKVDLMKQIEENANGAEPEVVPADGPKQFLTCNMLWDRVQRSEKVQSGEADMDELCMQLKAKAKCSGSGAVIDTKDVDAILGPPTDPHKTAMKMFS